MTLSDYPKILAGLLKILCPNKRLRQEFRKNTFLSYFRRDRIFCFDELSRFKLLFSIFMFIGSGCTHYSGSKSEFLADGFQPPKKIAVLPLTNDTNNVQGPAIFRNNLVPVLEQNGYKFLYNHDVDQILRDNFGITAGGQLQSAPSREIGDALGVEALIYGNVIQYRDYLYALDRYIMIRINLKLVNAQTGSVIWENEKGMKQVESVIVSNLQEKNPTLEIVKRQEEVITNTFLQTQVRQLLETMFNSLPEGPLKSGRREDPWLLARVPSLIQALNDGERPEIRFKSAVKLLEIDPSIEAGVKAIDKLLKAGNTYMCWIALEVLSNIGPYAQGAIQGIARCLGDRKKR